MLMNAGNKNVPSQNHFIYGHHDGEKENEGSFSDDEEDGENGEDDDDDGSDYEDGELNSAQKKKLKQDLMMMGYGKNGGFGEDGDDDDIDIVAA